MTSRVHSMKNSASKKTGRSGSSSGSGKDPYIFDFLGLPDLGHCSENDLEKRLIENLSSFLLELGQGFAYIGNHHYYVDLVLPSHPEVFCPYRPKTRESKPSGHRANEHVPELFYRRRKHHR